MIDLYCERIAPGWWGEPFNVISSTAYLLAGLALLRLASRVHRSTATTRVVAWLPVAIAAGSGLFHAAATPWARRFDEMPILVFELLVLAVYARRAIRLPRVVVIGVVILFVAAVAAIRYGVEGVNGSLPYVPALVVGAAIAWWHARHVAVDRLTPTWGVVALAFALMWRTMDLAVCGRVPMGTHFLWHVFTAAAVYAFGRTVLQAEPQASNRTRAS